jgi:hypothetical protein
MYHVSDLACIKQFDSSLKHVHFENHTGTADTAASAHAMLWRVQERQQLQRCLLHTVNNLLQQQAWTVQSLNELCDSIQAQRWGREMGRHTPCRDCLNCLNLGCW